MADFNEYIASCNYSWLIDFIKQHGERKNYVRNEIFSPIHSVSKEIGFVERGAFRYTAYASDGTPCVVGYAFENSFVCDYASLALQKPSDVDIEAMTDCVILSIHLKKFSERINTDIEVALRTKHITELLYAESYKRYIELYTRTAEERYRELTARCPQILNLVSLKELASYLNIRPETLSRIRTKLYGK